MVFYGAGDGTFQESTSLLTTVGAPSIVVDDFDDGAGADLAVLSPETLAVFLSAPGRVFTHHPILRPAFDDRVFHFGDLDGSGAADFLLVRQRAGIAFLNTGGGTFQRISGFPAELSLARQARVLADFNGDGCDDLISSEPLVGRLAPPGLRVRLGRCDGTFQEPLASELTQDVQALSLADGDINGDGIPDLVAGTHLRRYVSLLGRGDGTFQPLPEATGAGTYVLLEDFDGDGALDLSATEYSVLQAALWDLFPSSFDYEPVLSGNGDGTFFNPLVAQSDVLLGDFRDVARRIVPVELNGDGRLDFAVTTNYGRVRTYVARDGGFEEQSLVDGLGPFDINAVSGDLDGDGAADLVVTGLSESGSRPVQVLRNMGDGTLVDSGVVIEGLRAVTGDFDGDGTTDVVVTRGTEGIALHRNTNAGLFIGAPSPSLVRVPGFSARDLVAGDFDNDRAVDLIALGRNVKSPAMEVRVFWNGGDGSLEGSLVDRPRPGVLAMGGDLGDFNGDGRKDLVVVLEHDEGMFVYLGEGGRSFQAPRHFPAPSLPFAVADLDLDGRTDFVFSEHEEMFVTVQRWGSEAGSLEGGFEAPETYGVAENSRFERAFQMQDIDADGDLDFVYATAWGIAAVRNRTVNP